MLPIEALKKSSVHAMDEISHWYHHHTRKSPNRDKCSARRKKECGQMEAFSVLRRVKKTEAIDGTHVRMKEPGNLRYECEECAHRKVDKIIEKIEQVTLMEKRDGITTTWECEANRIGYETLIERIVHDAVAAIMAKGEVNSVNKKLSSLEEPQFTWTVPYHETKQKSVRKVTRIGLIKTVKIRSISIAKSRDVVIL